MGTIDPSSTARSETFVTGTVTVAPTGTLTVEDRAVTFRSPTDAMAAGLGLAPGDDIVAYCRIGERSSHTWFVLTYLLGYENVRNYDGSWTEWGNMVRAPIAKGEAAG